MGWSKQSGLCLLLSHAYLTKVRYLVATSEGFNTTVIIITMNHLQRYTSLPRQCLARQTSPSLATASAITFLCASLSKDSMRVFQRSSQAYEPDHAKAANSYPCFFHARSDCDSSTNLPGALSEKLMLQKWPRTEVHLSSLLQYSADPGLQALQNSPRPASPTISAAYISPRNAAPLPPATAHARINPTLTCNCSRVLQML